MEDKPCYVYVIECNNDNLYTGITNDVLRRWREHKDGIGAKYIKNNGFKCPVFLKEYKNKSEARKFEIKIKKMNKKQKIELINSSECNHKLLFNYTEILYTKTYKKIYK